MAADLVEGPGARRTRTALDPLGVAAALAVLAVGVAAFALARAALLPDVGLWDTAEAQTVPPLLGTMHPTGFPAYVVLGWLASVVLAPLGSVAFRMDLLSAILVGVAAAAVVVLVRQLTSRLVLGVAAGLGFATTPLVWSIGTAADPHALHLAIVGILLVALVGWAARRSASAPSADRWLLASAAIVGLGLADHRLIVFFGPGIAAYVLLVEPRILGRRRLLLRCAGVLALVVGLLYLELPLRAGPFRAPLVYGHPDTFSGFWYVVLGVQFGGTFDPPLADPGRAVDALATLLNAQLGPLAPLVPLAMLATIVRRPRYALLTIPTVLLTWLFAASYENADIQRYYLGPLLIGWTWLAIGAMAIVELAGGSWPNLGLRRGAGSRRPSGRDRATLAAVGLMSVALVLPSIAELPARYATVDRSHDVTARTWLDAALAALAPHAVVVSWWSYSTPLWYAQFIEGRRTDVWVVDDRTRLDEHLGAFTDVIDANLGRRPVYAIRVDPADIAVLVRRYDLTVVSLPAGPSLMRIVGLRSPAP